MLDVLNLTHHDTSLFWLDMMRNGLLKTTRVVTVIKTHARLGNLPLNHDHMFLFA